MNVQIIFKNGRTMLLDNIESYEYIRPDNWRLTDKEGEHSYITDPIAYIGRPEVRPQIIQLEPVPIKKKGLFGL